ncbi:hypothetical protein B0H17DRAFT_1149653 [Mycena rosella]|uniref:Uncharacterized protein n=1 Tax=Mycena rosella TaxID=1033263 RepID=A0AAD7C0F7_MYCRO|nr:hypothetical protein B0H17DRAFT_1149653 [Mycena rosella]
MSSVLVAFVPMPATRRPESTKEMVEGRLEGNKRRTEAVDIARLRAPILPTAMDTVNALESVGHICCMPKWIAASSPSFFLIEESRQRIEGDEIREWITLKKVSTQIARMENNASEILMRTQTASASPKRRQSKICAGSKVKVAEGWTTLGRFSDVEPEGLLLTFSTGG